MMAADEAPLSEVTVTGSRILRRDADANSPLVTVDAASLETRTGLNVESYLNELPNCNPAVTPETGNTAVGSSSISTVGYLDGSRCAASAPTAAWCWLMATASLQ